MSDRPRLVIIAGANGVGKSTIANVPEAVGLLGDAPAINPDQRTIQLQGRYSLSGVSANLLGVVQAELEVWRAIAEGKSVAVETVLSTDKFLPIIRTAHDRHFRVVLLYIALPTVDYSIARVRARVKSGGHNVPEQKIRERWSRSLDRFARYIEEADDVALFSNAGTRPVLVGRRVDRGPFELYDTAELPEITLRLTN